METHTAGTYCFQLSAYSGGALEIGGVEVVGMTLPPGRGEDMPPKALEDFGYGANSGAVVLSVGVYSVRGSFFTRDYTPINTVRWMKPGLRVVRS